MDQKLRNYQKEAANAIYKLFQSSCDKGKMISIDIPETRYGWIGYQFYKDI